MTLGETREVVTEVGDQVIILGAKSFFSFLCSQHRDLLVCLTWFPVNQGAEEELDLPRTAVRAFCTQWNKLLHFGFVTLSLSFSVRVQPGKLELLCMFNLRGFNEEMAHTDDGKAEEPHWPQ